MRWLHLVLVLLLTAAPLRAQSDSSGKWVFRDEYTPVDSTHIVGLFLPAEPRNGQSGDFGKPQLVVECVSHAFHRLAVSFHLGASLGGEANDYTVSVRLGRQTWKGMFWEFNESRTTLYAPVEPWVYFISSGELLDAFQHTDTLWLQVTQTGNWRNEFPVLVAAFDVRGFSKALPKLIGCH